MTEQEWDDWETEQDGNAELLAIINGDKAEFEKLSKEHREKWRMQGSAMSAAGIPWTSIDIWLTRFLIISLAVLVISRHC